MWRTPMESTSRSGNCTRLSIYIASWRSNCWDKARWIYDRHANVCDQVVGSGARILKRLAHHDFRVANEKLRRALFRSANNGKQAVDLFAGDQAEHATGRA